MNNKEFKAVIAEFVGTFLLSAVVVVTLSSQVFPVATPMTVSYTHLRAHETVLDLVCRLLLEKKKNTHTHTTIISQTHI